MHYKLNYNLLYLLLSILIILSYFLGFYFNEDAAGGGKIDLYSHEWDNINFFKNFEISAALSDLRYRSGRTPLYLIINKFNPFTNNIEEFRRSLDEIINHDAFSDNTQNILFGEDAKYNRELIDENYTSVKIAAAYNKIYRYLRKEIESYKSEFI